MILFFLEIKMGGIGGIETARRLREKNNDLILIFVTGVREYVFDALDLYAFQYLLKPVSERKLSEVLNRAIKEAEKNTEKRELFIKAKKLTVDQADILYIESIGKKAAIPPLLYREYVAHRRVQRRMHNRCGRRQSVSYKEKIRRV